MSQSFDVQSYTTTVIQSTNITNRLAELEQGINVLDIELQTQVCFIFKQTVIKFLNYSVNFFYYKAVKGQHIKKTISYLKA